jgi:hypothetical protein
MSHSNTDTYDSYVVRIVSNESDIDNFTENGHKYCALSHNIPYKVKMTNNTDLRANAILRIDGEIMGKWRLNAYSDIIVERPTHNNRKFIFVREDSWEGGMGGIKKGDNMNGVVEVTFIPETRTYDDIDYDGSFDKSFDKSDPWYHLKEAGLPIPDNKSDYAKWHHLKNIYVSDGFGRSVPLINGSGGNFMQNAKLSTDMSNSASDGIESQTKGSYRSYESFGVGGTVLGGSSGQRFGSASHIIEDMTKKQIKRIRLVVKKTKPIQPYVSIKTKNYVDSDNGRYDDQIPPQLKSSLFIKPFTVNSPVSDSWTIWPF